MPDGVQIVHLPARPMSGDRLLPLHEARAALLRDIAPVGGITSRASGDALGRVLAEAPRARASTPPFDQSAMDGYGLHAANLAAGTALPVTRRIAAGDPPGAALVAGQAVRILTGAASPPGVAAVVMEEQVLEQDGTITLKRPVKHGENLRLCGEDVAAGDVLLRPGLRLDARHLALLASAGIAHVAVRRPLRVAVLSNGNELGAAVHDSNRPMLLALLRGAGIEATDLGIVPDRAVELAAVLGQAASDHDAVLASGGISGSEADCLPAAARMAGGEITTMKLAVKPGKPLAFGSIGHARCLFLPGNPLAALVGMLTLGRPLLARLAGEDPVPLPRPIAARAGETVRRKPGREEFLPARIMDHDAFGAPILRAAGCAGSARLVPLASADGMMHLPADAEGLQSGDAVAFHPFQAAFGL